MGLKTVPFAVAALFLVIPGHLLADVLLLRDQTHITGRILGQDGKFYRIQTYDQGEQRVRKSEVRHVTRCRSLFDEYDERRKKARTAQAHFDLASWCREKNLWELAVEQCKQSLRRDRGFSPARRALGYVRQSGRWVHKKRFGYICFEGTWLPRKEAEKAYLKAQVVALDLRATYPGKASKGRLARFGQRVEQASAYAWRLTHGQMYVRSVAVGDRANDGTIRIVRDSWNRYKAGEGYYGRAFSGSHIEVAGMMPSYTFLHEFMHCIFHLPDEYGKSRCRCCIMSADPYADKLCDHDDHVGEGPSCWERLLRVARHASWKGRRPDEKWGMRYPNPYKDLMKCPPTKVSIKKR
jgi:hypothetical protein